MDVRYKKVVDLAVAVAGHGNLARALAQLLALIVAFVHAFLRTDWLKFVGSPSVTAGVFLVVPAAWLVIRDNFLVAMGAHAALSTDGAWVHGAPERRARDRG